MFSPRIFDSIVFRKISLAGLLSLALTSCGGSSGASFSVIAGMSISNVTPYAGEPVQLGLGSTSGHVGSVQWEILSGPKGHNGSIQQEPGGFEAIFTANVLGEYMIRLTVTATDGGQDEAVAVITVINAPPMAKITTSDGRSSGDTFVVDETIEFSAAESTDHDGDVLSFSWEISSKPTGSTATLSARSGETTFLNVSQPGRYSVRLIADDGTTTNFDDFHSDVEVDYPPDIVVPAYVGYIVGDSVFVDASDSVDPNNRPLAFTWELISQPSGDSVSLEPGENDALVSFTPTSAGPYMLSLTVSDGTLSAQKDVSISGASEFLQLDVEVADAEVDIANDRIILVSKFSNELLTIDRTTKAISRVSLLKSPTSVSVSPDGSEAIVGHDAMVSVIDLGTMTVSDTYSISTNAIDVVHGGNGFAYIFPKIDQWETIRAIELATGLETLSTGHSIRAGTFAKKQPGSSYIYGADNGLSPSDIEKYGIGSGTPAYLYDSPYHGDFPMCGNLWFTDAGDRIITACGNIFATSDVQEFDMIFDGALALDPNNAYAIYRVVIRFADHLPAAGEIATVVAYDDFSSIEYLIKVFDDSSLEEKHSYGIPEYLSGETIHRMIPQFIFRSGAIGEYLMIADVQEADNPKSLILLYD